MKTTTVPTEAPGFNWITLGLGILAFFLVFAVLTGRQIPLISNERVALLLLVGLGMAICSQGGIGPVADEGAWLHPFSILAYLLGGIILVIGLAAVFGVNIPPLTSYYRSFQAVTVLAAAKLLLTTIHRLFL